MKKLSFLLIGLIGLTPGLQASSSFSYFTAESKSLLCALVRGIKHFYFPDYSNLSTTNTTEVKENSLALMYRFDSDLDEELATFCETPQDLFRPVRERSSKKRSNSKETTPKMIACSLAKSMRSDKITFFSF
jgi:hypothetical protein